MERVNQFQRVAGALGGLAVGDAPGDPFEFGSARPLDFGHWAAHKLEQLSDFKLRHGEAVAIGIAVDVLYSRRIGLIEAEAAERVLRLLEQLALQRLRRERLLPVQLPAQERRPALRSLVVPRYPFAL